jgi:hypothetical protein
MDETLLKIPNSNNINNNNIEVEENNNNLKESILLRSSNDFNIPSNESSELTSSSLSSISENLNSTIINKTSKEDNDVDIRTDIIMPNNNANDEKNNIKLIKDVASSLSSTTSNEEDEPKSLEKDEDILLNRSTSRTNKRKLNDEINTNLSLLAINSVESPTNIDMDDSIENFNNNNNNETNIVRQNKIVKYDNNNNNNDGTLPVKQQHIKKEENSESSSDCISSNKNNMFPLDIFNETSQAVSKLVSQKDLPSTFSTFNTDPYKSVQSNSSNNNQAFSLDNENFTIIISNNDQIIQSTSKNVNTFINFVQVKKKKKFKIFKLKSKIN